MAKEKFDVTRITLNVMNLENSETIMRFSDAELGQWLRLFCKAVSIAKECTLPNDRELLRTFVRSNLSDRVLAAFPLVNAGEMVGRRRNDVQYAEWLRSQGRSVVAAINGSAAHEPDPSINPLESSKLNSNCTSIAQPANGGGSTNRTEQNITKHNNTKQQSVGDVLDQVAKTGQPTEPGIDSNGRKKGEPGYYERGQYPGTDPKKIFKFMQDKWSDVKGEAALAKYPSKYPDAWVEICSAKSPDLIVPAFELWCHREGQFMNTAWPVSEFLRSAEKYMAEVKPLLDARPKVTAEKLKESYDVGRKQNEEMFPELKAVDEADPNSLFDEEKS